MSMATVSQPPKRWDMSLNFWNQVLA